MNIIHSTGHADFLKPGSGDRRFWVVDASHHKAHITSEGTRSAVLINRMYGREQVASALEPLPIRTAVRPRFTPTANTEAGHAAAKRAGA